METPQILNIVRTRSREVTIDIDAGAKPPEEYYHGSYEATPTNEEQTLNTAGYFMLNDVAIHPVPYAEATNPKGGYTVTIGG